MSEDELPEADAIDGAPHPRMVYDLFGQADAEQQFLDALNEDRLHHAWLITGPRGIGKATLAWKLARYLIANPPPDNGPSLFGGDASSAVTDLNTAPEHPVSRRLEAMSESGLMLIRRAWDKDRKKLKAQITVDEVRKLGNFFGMSSVDGGRRVVIVDAMDDMNVSSANALLKVLEEPPKNAILLLVSHTPARLLPTIRSRCRELRAATLTPEDLAQVLQRNGLTAESAADVSRLAGGSAGEAIRLAEHDGPALYTRLIALLGTCPAIDRAEIQKLVDHIAARAAPNRIEVFLTLLDIVFARLARAGLNALDKADHSDREFETLAKLAPNVAAARKWATLHQETTQRIAHGRAVNIDLQSLLTDVLLKINEAAARS